MRRASLPLAPAPMTPTRTGKGNTTPRSIRIPTDLWQAALNKARGEGTTLTAVVTQFLRTYTASK